MKKPRTITEKFEIVVDGSPMEVHATLFETATTEARYRVSVDGSPVYIFGWDPRRNRLAAIDSGQAVTDLPERMEVAIGQKLYTRMAA